MTRITRPSAARSRLLSAALCLSVGLTMTSRLAAQDESGARSDPGSRWTWIDAVGYGGLGFGLGLLAAWDLEGTDIGPPAEGLLLVGATTAAGLAGGTWMGRRADRAVAAGRPVRGLHRLAVLGGAVLAGSTLGALATVPLINSEGQGTPFGSDEQTAVLFTAAGAVLGAIYAWTQRDELDAGGIAALPGLLDGGRPGIEIRIAR